MDASTRAALVVSAAAGYVVGRTKTEKLALGLLSLMTGRALDPTDRIGRGIRNLAENPQIEQFSESLTRALSERTRSLLDSETGGEQESPEGGGEAGEPDEEEMEAPRPSRPRRAGRAQAAESSAHAAGPRNPPAARAKAMGRKAKAERSARRPGPKNPPAAKAKALGRKTATERAAGKGSPAPGSRRR